MPNVYTLFGELKGDTTHFQKAMRDADKTLEGAKRNIESTERAAVGLGQTSATVARQYQKLNDRIADSNKRLNDAATGFKRGDVTAKQMASALVSVDKAAASVNSRLRDTSARLADVASRASKIPGQMQAAGQGMMSFGRSMSIGITAPLAAFGLAAANSSISIDAMRNKMIAATGSVEKANAKIKELRDLAASNAGVFANAAGDTFAYFKAMKVGDGTINELIKAFGKLKLANESLDVKEFSRNLSQLFDQKFEMQDLKQAIGVFPQFGQIAQKAFGLTGSSLDEVQEGLQNLVISGKLTREEFLKLFAAAVQGDAVFGSMAEGAGVRFQKMMERLFISLEPLGNALLKIAEPIGNLLTPAVERVSAAFANLSPTMQTVFLALGGIAAVAGPVIVVFGAIVSAIGAIVGSAATIGIVTAAIVGLSIQMAPLIGIAAAWYAAWQTNFGGVRELVATVASAIGSAWDAMTVKVSELNAKVTAETSKFWNENGEDIKKAVAKASEAVKTIWQGVLAFWKTHGESLKAITSAVWGVISTVVVAAVRHIGGVIKLLAAIINGDWSKAWQATKGILNNVIAAWLSLLVNAGSLIVNAIKMALQNVWSLGGWILGQAKILGTSLIKGFALGILSGESVVISAAKSIATSAITSAKGILGIQSPSKVFFAIGKDTAQGFVDGIAAMKASTQKAMASILDVSGMKLGKGDSAGVELLTSLVGDLSKVNVVTKEAEVRLLLTAAAYDKVNKAVKERIILAAKELDNIDANKEGAAWLEKLRAIGVEVVEATNLQATANLLATEKMKGLTEETRKLYMWEAARADLRLSQAAIDELDSAGPNTGIPGTDNSGLPNGEGIGGFSNFPPPPIQPWNDFWGMMQNRLSRFRDSLPSMKEAIGVNLVDSISRIGDVFANAVMQWDGTAKGFFKSIATGFADMARQIIAEMIKIAVMKAVLNLFQGLLGGKAPSIPGGGLGGLGDSAFSPDGTGFASGGFTGFGGKFDPAGIVHKGEYVIPKNIVSQMGVGFFDSLLGNQPQMSYAGGGMVGGSSNIYNNSSASNVWNINVQGGTSREQNMQTASMVRREIAAVMQQDQMRNK